MRTVLTTFPITTIVLLSTAGLWLSASMVSSRAVGITLFYLLGVPAYLVHLVASAIGTSLGLRPSWWLGIGLCLASDLVLSLLTGRLRWWVRG